MIALVLCLLSAPEGVKDLDTVLDGILARVPSSPAPAATVAGEKKMPDLVEGFVRHYQGRGRSQFESAVRRLEPYRPMLERTFATEGIPNNLVWIGLVESGYIPTARSAKDAVGIWQLMADTARQQGIAPEERTDPEKSTRAAARLLRTLYGRFGDWNLVLAAYNAGPERVDSAMARAGTRDFWELASRGLLPRETIGYVPAVLAAAKLGGDEVMVNDAAARPKILYAPFALSH